MKRRVKPPTERQGTNRRQGQHSHPGQPSAVASQATPPSNRGRRVPAAAASEHFDLSSTTKSDNVRQYSKTSTDDEVGEGGWRPSNETGVRKRTLTGVNETLTSSPLRPTAPGRLQATVTANGSGGFDVFRPPDEALWSVTTPAQMERMVRSAIRRGIPLGAAIRQQMEVCPVYWIL